MGAVATGFTCTCVYVTRKYAHTHTHTKSTKTNCDDGAPRSPGISSKVLALYLCPLCVLDSAWSHFSYWLWAGMRPGRVHGSMRTRQKAGWLFSPRKEQLLLRTAQPVAQCSQEEAPGERFCRLSLPSSFES